jgi:deoxyhypusine synthase
MKSRGERAHRVAVDASAGTADAGCSFREWLATLPHFLGAEAFRATVDAIAAARRAGRPFVFAFGGHVIKTGCSPLVIDLIERGVITALATNGSGAIHDLELAETGATSEEVADTIRDGSFGMVHETCERMNDAARLGVEVGGLGRAVGRLLAEGDAPHKRLSLLAAAYRAGIPATVHVAIGTDTVHMHPQADGAAIGTASLADFRTICAVVAEMGAAEGDAAGGVWLNAGSAVVLPEVFLKAVSVARNLGHGLRGMHTANFDMLRHYRPAQNVVGRPVEAGHGHSVVGHHEILLPLLRQAVIEDLAD